MTDRDEGGFTLIELVVATAITMIVIGVVSAALIAGMRMKDATRDRVNESNDAELVSTWFVTDVQSADTVATSDGVCGFGSGTTAVVSLKWTDPVTATVTYANYAVVTAGGETDLVRRHCIGSTPAETATLARSLASSPAPALTCSPSPCGSTTRTVSLAVTELSGFTFTVSGSRRVS